MTHVEYVPDDRYGPSCKGGWVTVEDPKPAKPVKPAKA